MKSIFTLLALCLLSYSQTVNASTTSGFAPSSFDKRSYSSLKKDSSQQKNGVASPLSDFTLTFGAGYLYGFYGLRLSYEIVRNGSVFASLGYVPIRIGDRNFQPNTYTVGIRHHLTEKTDSYRTHVTLSYTKSTSTLLRPDDSEYRYSQFFSLGYGGSWYPSEIGGFGIDFSYQFNSKHITMDLTEDDDLTNYKFYYTMEFYGTFNLGIGYQFN